MLIIIVGSFPQNNSNWEERAVLETSTTSDEVTRFDELTSCVSIFSPSAPDLTEGLSSKQQVSIRLVLRRKRKANVWKGNLYLALFSRQIYHDLLTA